MRSAELQGIAETNLVGLLGELGATWSRWGQPLFSIGVPYDPFVERPLEPWSGRRGPGLSTQPAKRPAISRAWKCYN